MKREELYTALLENQYSVQINPFKQKKIYLKEFNCERQVPVQEGVDVAIAMKAMKAALNPKITRIVIVSGDGDFAECLQAIQEDAGKKVFMFGWRGSFNHKLKDILVDKPVFFDVIWRELTAHEEGDHFMAEAEHIDWSDLDQGGDFTIVRK